MWMLLRAAVSKRVSKRSNDHCPCVFSRLFHSGPIRAQRTPAWDIFGSQESLVRLELAEEEMPGDAEAGGSSAPTGLVRNKTATALKRAAENWKRCERGREVFINRL